MAASISSGISVNTCMSACLHLAGHRRSWSKHVCLSMRLVLSRNNLNMNLIYSYIWFLKNYCFSPTPSQPFLRSRMRNCLLKAKCICCCELQNMELSCIQHVRLQNVSCFYTKKWFIHTVRVEMYKMMSCRTSWKRLSGMLIVLSVFTCTATWRVVQTGNWGLIRSPLCHCFW